MILPKGFDLLLDPLPVNDQGSGGDTNGQDSGGDTNGQDSGGDTNGQDSGGDTSGQDSGGDTSGQDAAVRQAIENATYTLTNVNNNERKPDSTYNASVTTTPAYLGDSAPFTYRCSFITDQPEDGKNYGMQGEAMTVNLGKLNSNGQVQLEMDLMVFVVRPQVWINPTQVIASANMRYEDANQGAFNDSISMDGDSVTSANIFADVTTSSSDEAGTKFLMYRVSVPIKVDPDGDTIIGFTFNSAGSSEVAIYTRYIHAPDAAHSVESKSADVEQLPSASEEVVLPAVVEPAYPAGPEPRTDSEMDETGYDASTVRTKGKELRTVELAFYGKKTEYPNLNTFCESFTVERRWIPLETKYGKHDVLMVASNPTPTREITGASKTREIELYNKPEGLSAEVWTQAYGFVAWLEDYEPGEIDLYVDGGGTDNQHSRQTRDIEPATENVEDCTFTNAEGQVYRIYRFWYGSYVNFVRSGRYHLRVTHKNWKGFMWLGFAPFGVVRPDKN